MVRPFGPPEEPPSRPKMPDHIKKLIETWSQDLADNEVVQIYGERMKGMNTRQGMAEESHAYHQKVNPTDTAKLAAKDIKDYSAEDVNALYEHTITNMTTRRT